MTELTSRTATQLIAAYSSRQLSPVEVTRATLDRARAIQPALNAFVRLDEEAALEQARASEERWRRGEPTGAVDGVPATVKDILLQKGGPTVKGSWGVDDPGPWEEDSPAVQRLREQGAVLLGKTTTPEFGWKGVTDSPRHGATGNPYDPTRTAGGSSGGGAAAVATGAGPLTLGTDGGGSVRIPGSFCGIFALKPTYGRVPIYPASAFGTLAHVGPMTRTVGDAALLMDVITRPDPRDWSQLAPPEGSFRSELDRGVRGLRVAYAPTLFDHPVDPEVARAVRSAVDRLAEAGALVEEADPGFTDPVEAFHVLWFAGAARVTQSFDEERRARMDPGLREIVERGAAYSALDYLAAMDVRMALGRQMGLFHQRYDLLVTPTMPGTAFELGVEVPAGSPYQRWTGWTPFTYPFNMTQQPAATVPCGVDARGLPIGVQLVAARHGDPLVLRAAQSLYEAGVADIPAPARVWGAGAEAGSATPAGS
ncbi:amidase [Streptomyces sp. NPDC005438]|uniref:amidase n=1 Tax=Streptomyces sp. NPDC005438 TaxID=3156880 RepID=UPI0033B8DC22